MHVHWILRSFYWNVYIVALGVGNENQIHRWNAWTKLPIFPILSSYPSESMWLNTSILSLTAKCCLIHQGRVTHVCVSNLGKVQQFSNRNMNLKMTVANLWPRSSCVIWWRRPSFSSGFSMPIYGGGIERNARIIIYLNRKSKSQKPLSVSH